MSASPRLARGRLIAITILLALGTFTAHHQTSYASLATPAQVTVSPKATVAGSTISATGTGFEKSGLVAVWADFRTPKGTQRSTLTAHTTSTGTFDSKLPVPTTALTGVYTVTARDFHQHRAIASVAVRPGITVEGGLVGTSLNVTPGKPFLISGRRFGANERVTISIPARSYAGTLDTITRTVAADSAGSFAAQSFSLPLGTITGSLPVSFYGAVSGRSSVATLVVAYHPILTVLPPLAAPGTKISIHGAGFVPLSRVTITLAAPTGKKRIKTRTTAIAGSGGAIVTSLRVPSWLSIGSYVLAASGDLGGAHVSRRFAVSTEPFVTAVPKTVAAGGSVTVQGFNFSAGAPIWLSTSIRLAGGDAQVVERLLTASSDGAFKTSFRVAPTAARGNITISVLDPSGAASTVVLIESATPTITVSPDSAAPGTSVTVRGTGFPQGDTVTVSARFTLQDGALSTVSRTASTPHGTFSESFPIPATAVGGLYELLAQSKATGKSIRSHVTVVALAPALVTSVPAAAPGTEVGVSGFAFGPGASVTIKVGSASAGPFTTGSDGRFDGTVAIPTNLPAGSYVVRADASDSTTASTTLKVRSTVPTTSYFASLYTGTGYHEYLAAVNPTETDAHLTVVYTSTSGSPRTRHFTVHAHSRYTRNVNHDLGSSVSAAAWVTADQPVAVERLVYRGSDIAVDSGSAAPAESWYFAAGSTAGGYHEYLAIQNPGSKSVEVGFHFMPSHARPFTLFKSVRAKARLTVNVSVYVPNDAAGVTLTAPSPIVANRTIYMRHGMASETGVTAPQKEWIIAAGPRQEHATSWLSVLNPSGHSTFVTVHAYGVHGGSLGTIQSLLGPYRVGSYQVTRIAHGHVDVGLVVDASTPVVSEQSTYVGEQHNATTGVFGVPTAQTSWAFAAAATRADQHETDMVDLFNPNPLPAAVLVRFFSTTGASAQSIYIVAPHGHSTVDVTHLAPGVQLGITVRATEPIVALNRSVAGNGAATSFGVRQPG